MAQSSRTTATLRIGTRGSPLALAQANMVRDALAAARGLDLGFDPSGIEITVIRTSGDRIQDRPLSESGGKGLFTKEIEDALLAGEIDLAVHSAKDLTTLLPPGLVLPACLPREDARDAFISRKAVNLSALHKGATLGTASLRRAAQVKRVRPDLQIVPLRGNVETRLRKLDDGAMDATILALAGLKRLGRADAATALLEPGDFLPAVGQGVIALQAREDDDLTREALAAINHPATATALAAERAFLEILDGSCRTPIAGHATISNDRLQLRGMIIRPDGSEAHETVREGHVREAAALGADAGRELKGKAGSDFFKGP
jgi:hydroxymethylbilane synthase